MRSSFYISTACYLIKEDKVLLIKFNKKWGQVYAPIGGKMENGETPTECVIREFKEETGLTLVNPKLQGISYWQDSFEGIIFVYTAEDYEGKQIVFLGILKGSVMFMVELAKRIKNDVSFEFIEVSSYEGTESTGNKQG